MPTRKFSRQRSAILDFLSTRKDHPTADVIYTNIRLQYPNISLGTVYRNLTLLSESGEILRLRLDDGVDHYDADTSAHYHFICRGCGKVIDLAMNDISSINQTAARHFDGRIDGNTTYFYGLCKDCCRAHHPETS